MVSPNEASFDLRENPPLPRNILHTCEVMAYGSTGQRTDRKVFIEPTGHRGWLRGGTIPKVSAGYLQYSADVRDSAKSGLGHKGNRHLRYLVESLAVNVGGSCRNVKASSLPMIGMSVGGFIVVRVVRARESRSRGEAAIRSLEMTRCVRDEGLRSKRSLITWGS